MLMKEVKEVVDTVSVALANGQPEEAGNVVMQEVNHALLSMGVDEAMADKIDNFIILLFIIGIALLANLICRKIILRTVAKLVRQTKATWDDIVFNDKVMVNISRMVAPILIYISIPIAFPEHADSALLDFLRRLCMIYILAVFLRFVSALFTAVYLVYSAREQYKDKPLKGLLQTAQVILFFIGAIIIISILIKQSPVVLLTGLGASAAVLMLVFKDSIMGFVSGIQLSANNMLKVGDVHEKEKLRKEEKKRIATAAAKLIEENDSIIIASGSTVHTFAEHITPINHLTVVTASLKTSLLLNTINNIEVIQLGGIVRKNSFSVIGDYTSLFFEQITCSKLFLGVDGIDLEYGITNSNIEEAVLNKKMIEASLRTIILADSSKFGRRGFGKICSLDCIDVIITDSGISQSMAQAIEEMGIELIVV